MENLRRGHGGLAMDKPVLLRVAIASAKLAEAIYLIAPTGRVSVPPQPATQQPPGDPGAGAGLLR